MQRAFAKNKGALHRELGVGQDKKIPMSKLLEAAKAKDRLGRRARAALNARRATQ